MAKPKTPPPVPQAGSVPNAVVVPSTPVPPRHIFDGNKPNLSVNQFITKGKPIVKGNHYFLVGDRRALNLDKRKEHLNHGKLKIHPIAMSIGGRLGYYGGRLLDVVDGVACIINTGTIEDEAAIISIRRRDGILEITEEIINKIARIGIETGVIEGELA